MAGVSGPSAVRTKTSGDSPWAWVALQGQSTSVPATMQSSSKIRLDISTPGLSGTAQSIIHRSLPVRLYSIIANLAGIYIPLRIALPGRLVCAAVGGVRIVGGVEGVPLLPQHTWKSR